MDVQPRLNSTAYFLTVETMVKIRPNVNQVCLFIFVDIKWSILLLLHIYLSKKKIF